MASKSCEACDPLCSPFENVLSRCGVTLRQDCRPASLLLGGVLLGLQLADFLYNETGRYDFLQELWIDAATTCFYLAATLSVYYEETAYLVFSLVRLPVCNLQQIGGLAVLVTTGPGSIIALLWRLCERDLSRARAADWHTLGRMPNCQLPVSSARCGRVVLHCDGSMLGENNVHRVPLRARFVLPVPMPLVASVPLLRLSVQECGARPFPVSSSSSFIPPTVCACMLPAHVVAC